MADLGAVTYTAVTWTAGDVITEAKMDNMVANDQAYDSHSAQGLLLNNEKALAGKDIAGDAQNIIKINSSDEVVGGFNSVGWIEVGETWTFASADDPTYTYTIAGVDLTGKYSAGMRVKLTNGGSVKYFIITKVAFSTNTTVTVYGGTDYDLADSAITLPYYSTQKAPQGFPLDPDKWTEETTSSAQDYQPTPTASTWYNWRNLTIPIGLWDVSWTAIIQIDDAGAGDLLVYATLSKSNSAEDDEDFSIATRATTARIHTTCSRQKFLNLSAKDVYYLNIMTSGAGIDNIRIRGDTKATVIKAVCAYL